MSFFDIFKRINTKTLAKEMRQNPGNETKREALNNLISEEALEGILNKVQTSMLEGEEAYNNGINSVNNGDIEDAIEHFAHSIELNNKASGPYSSRGTLYMQIGDYKKGISDLETALELEGKEDTGNLLAAENNLSVALEQVETALKVAPLVYKLIDEEVHGNYTIKIQAPDPRACDLNTDATAKNKIVNAIIQGEMEMNNMEEICNTYMAVRESLIIENGGFPRWVEKNKTEDLLGQNKLERKKKSEPKINDLPVLYVNNTFPGLGGFTFEFEVELGDVRTAMVSSDPESSDLFIRLAKFSINVMSLPGFEKPTPTKLSDIVEVKRELGDMSVFTPGLYRVGDLDGDVAPLTFFQAFGPELPEAEDNPLNIPPEFAHDFFITLRVLSEGKGLPLEQIAAEYYLIYQIAWPEFSHKIYNTETIHGYKLAKEYRTSPYQMVMDIADLAYLELGYKKSFGDLNDDELKLLYVMSGYKLARVIYDKAPDDHPLKQAD